MSDSTPNTAREDALNRLKAKREFTASLVSYVIVNAFLWILWAITKGDGGGSPPWPIWVSVGWGIGLAFQAWNAYGRKPITDADIEREMRKGQ
jgi:hypothetical protein